jgi:NADH:ubiquinone reductase (H+-translocating)
VLARNIHAVLSGKPPEPFVYHTMGLMGSLGHNKGLAQVMKVRLRGLTAWWVRRTYYLSQMPGWGRRMRFMIDWTFSLMFRTDIAKVDLASERTLLSHNRAAGAIPAGEQVRFGDPGAGERAPASPDASPGLGDVRPLAEERV